jgi:hypothetical protein
MNPKKLYELYKEQMQTEGFDAMVEWDDLDPREMLAWGKLFRLLRREWEMWA